MTPEFLAGLRAKAEAAADLDKAWDDWCGRPDTSIDPERGAEIARAQAEADYALECEIVDGATVLALLDATEIGLEAKRRMERGRTWRSALTCGCIFEDPDDPDRCTRACDLHAALLAEVERLRQRCGCIIGDGYINPCSFHAAWGNRYEDTKAELTTARVEIERLRAEISGHAVLPQPVRSIHAD